MAQDDLALYLTLAPEFGGTRFGPFEGLEARLGSNPERCHITLPEALGVAKEHCKVIRQGGASMILAPADRTAAVWLWKGDARRPMQVQTPTAVRPGDSFALVTQDGPRFFIELAELPPELKAKRSPNRRGPQNLTAGKFASAGKDLFLARLYTYGPVSIAMRGLHFVKSGAIWQPRILILMAVTGFGYLSTAGASCAAFKFKSDLGAANAAVEECKEQSAFAGSVGDKPESWSVNELAGQMLGNQVGTALGKDSDLYGKVKTEAARIVNDADRYAWLQSKSSAVEDFAGWRERVEKAEEIDPVTRKLAIYVAATPRRTKGDWNKVLDSRETEVCGRGAARLTFRQARNLGLDNVQPDAFIAGDSTGVAGDETERGKLVRKTIEEALDTPPEPLPPTAVDIISAGEQACIRAEGDDDRDAPAKVVKMLTEELGKEAGYVPGPDTTFGAIARIAKLYAADVPGQRFGARATGIANFSKGMLSTTLSEVAGGDWVLDRTAEVIARSMVLPCDAVLNMKKADAEAIFGAALPDAISCLVLNYKLTHQAGE